MMHMTQNMESFCEHLYGPGGDRILGLGVACAKGRQIACQGAIALAVNCYAAGAWVGGMGIASCPCGALMALLCGSDSLVGKEAA